MTYTEARRVRVAVGRWALVFSLVASGLAALGLSTGACAAPAQALEKPKLTIAVGGKPGLYYLPLTIAEQLGYFKDEGLDVTIDDFAGGSKALQAVVGGSADVGAGVRDEMRHVQLIAAFQLDLQRLFRFLPERLILRADVDQVRIVRHEIRHALGFLTFEKAFDHFGIERLCGPLVRILGEDLAGVHAKCHRATNREINPARDRHVSPK